MEHPLYLSNPVAVPLKVKGSLMLKLVNLKSGIWTLVFTSLYTAAASAQVVDYCKREGGNSFTLSEANVNALVSLSCTALSHNETERWLMKRDNSTTLFHVWNTKGNSRQVTVTGYCAVPLTDLKANNCLLYTSPSPRD